MKSKLILIVMSFFLLAACTEESEDLVKNPEDALKMIELGNEDREIKVYGSHKVNEKLVLIVFKGAMNDEDIWVADVHNKENQWVVKEIVQMNGPVDSSADIQTVIVSDEFGYEVGYIKSDVSVPEELNVFEIKEISDWRIWIK